ncbi:hypothetical protein ACFX13_000985 [Malus domestica]|uniref:Uncharacterized protein n=1 Tax=Malus domestica TaxID=3750 RepID=A0A498KH61_MALDO|nr:hypothetical protein DVH24_005413 [Malus domestica]
MWAVSYPPPPPPSQPLIPKPPPTYPIRLSIVAKSQPPSQDLGGLGRSILTKLKSNPNPKLQGKQKQDEEDKKVISGSDVLSAMQRAAAKKNRESVKKKKKAPPSSSSSYAGSHREEEGVDEYGNVRPLCVKSEWGSRLDELGKRLQELSSKAP